MIVTFLSFFSYKVGIVYLCAPKLVQNEPAGRILELSILHLAMADISVLGTRHQIVINEVLCTFAFCINLDFSPFKHI